MRTSVPFISILHWGWAPQFQVVLWQTPLLSLNHILFSTGETLADKNHPHLYTPLKNDINELTFSNEIYQKKKSLYLLFLHLTSFKESYNVGKSITWLYNKREILSFFHWKMAFSSSFWDTSVRIWTTRACVPYLKHGGMGITRMATQPSPSAPSVAHLASIDVTELYTLETTSGGSVKVHVMSWQFFPEE